MKAKKISLGIMIPTLQKYGGAERYLIETVRFWQNKYDISIYSVKINHDLLKEHNISDKVKLVELTEFYDSDEELALLKNTTILTKIWRKEIKYHDVYIGHLWPMHFTELKPFVWVTHEPLRIMHDLKYEQTLAQTDSGLVKNFHLYPKFNYDKLHSTHEISLDIIDKLDRTFSPDVIIANSKYTAENLGKIYNNEATNYAVAYPGIDYDSFHEDFPFDKNLFVSIGQLWSHKRFHLLIEAIALTNDAQLIIIGDGPEKNRLYEIADKLGVSDRFFILSNLSNDDVLLLLARACGFLFSAFKEPFGIVGLEAMAAETPVIAVSEGGFTEVLDPSYSFLINPYPVEFAEKITFLQQNPEIARKMGKLARKKSSLYTWRQSSIDIENAVLSVMDNKSETKFESIDKKSLFGIQYFLWYGEGLGSSHWSDNPLGIVSEHPVLGYYSSLKGNTINNHIDIFESMGIDFVILNLHINDYGANEVEFHSIVNFTEILNKRNSNLKYVIQLCIYTQNISEISNSIKFINNNFFVDKNYLYRDGQPLLFWFWSGAYDTNKVLINQLKEITVDNNNIAFSNRMVSKNEKNQTYGLFSGFSPFNPLDLSAKDNWNLTWDQSYYDQFKDMKYKIFTLSPGYDDSKLEDPERINNKHRYVSRDNGDTYQLMFEHLLKLKKEPDFIIISTFNEYHENTNIEPTISYGDKYIELSRKFIKQYKEK